jgi:hypothetical protein
MSNILGKIFGKGGEEVTKTIAETIDGLSTSDEEKLIAKEKLTSTVMTHLVNALNAQVSILTAEANGSKLQRNWRPILMLSFGFIIIYEYFISKVFGLPDANLPERFWNLLELGMGGYVVGRSVEKIAETVTKNVDISFIKKKDRIN